MRGESAQGLRDSALVWGDSPSETSVSPPLLCQDLEPQPFFSHLSYFLRLSGLYSDVWHLSLGGVGLLFSLCSVH